MSTDANLVDKGTFLPLSDSTAENATQTANLAAQTPPSPDKRRELLDTLQSMHDWAVNSLTYVKRRAHLPFYQKHFVRERINQRITDLQNRISGLQVGTPETQLATFDSDLQQALIGQAEFNRYAWFYEFPRYALPQGIEQPFRFDPTLLDVLSINYRELKIYHALLLGDDMRIDTVNSLSMIEDNDLLLVTYRENYNEPRTVNLGYFRGLLDNRLVLQIYRKEYRQPDWSISMHEVVHIHRVKWKLSKEEENEEVSKSEQEQVSHE